MTLVAVADLGQVFRSEIKAAKQLGFELQCHLGERSVAARMQPRSPRAANVCRLASGKPGQAIESTAWVDESGDQMDALRDTIRSVLERAKELMP